MRSRTLFLALLVHFLVLGGMQPLAAQGAVSRTSRAIVLADLTWVQAKSLFTKDPVIVIPLGAAAKEHGPHLRLDNDFQMAEYLRGRVLAASEVIIAPTVTYHFYPAFLEYPGSTHIRLETARHMIVDIVRTLGAHGPRRFYVLNTGVSTMRPLQEAADSLRKLGFLMTFTDILQVAGPAEASVKQQARGTHADEIETSMMLYIAPGRVDMRKAAKDDSPQGTGGLTRKPGGPGTYSATGIWGDATLATREKGRIVVEATVAGILADIERLRGSPLPAVP